MAEPTWQIDVSDEEPRVRRYICVERTGETYVAWAESVDQARAEASTHIHVWRVLPA
ncbi:MAG: hypothetical protein ACREXW_01180 [Gammaproteobacteria bacterium]